jgi:hypothetical protein
MVGATLLDPDFEVEVEVTAWSPERRPALAG